MACVLAPRWYGVLSSGQFLTSAATRYAVCTVAFFVCEKLMRRVSKVVGAVCILEHQLRCGLPLQLLMVTA